MKSKFKKGDLLKHNGLKSTKLGLILSVEVKKIANAEEKVDITIYWLKEKKVYSYVVAPKSWLNTGAIEVIR